jgi:hypothetical protein
LHLSTRECSVAALVCNAHTMTSLLARPHLLSDQSDSSVTSRLVHVMPLYVHPRKVGTLAANPSPLCSHKDCVEEASPVGHLEFGDHGPQIGAKGGALMLLHTCLRCLWYLLDVLFIRALLGLLQR